MELDWDVAVWVLFWSSIQQNYVGKDHESKKNQALEYLVIHFCGKKSTISKLLIILCENFTLAIKY